MAEGGREFPSAWKDLRIEANEYRQLDSERLLVLACVSGRGKTSGLKVETNGASLLHVRDGKATKIVNYSDRERALADLGLSSETR
jgi:ketosteroid isomerase-like protein